MNIKYLCSWAFAE
uniref:Uncharacterized protein n=1 Tax=Anguilla anguilla TaxID=7936 RepID=A0A0E9TM68_ANGAN